MSTSPIMTRVYDPNVQYESGTFPYQRTAAEYSSSPVPPREPNPQNVLRVPHQEMQEEMVLRRADRGRDARKRVTDTHNFPNSIHVQLNMKFPGGLYGGSGVIVGPHHILTCAHNIYSAARRHWAEAVDVYPARDNENAPFGKASVTRAYLFEDWTTRGNEHLDIALLIINQSIGALTGWGGLFCGDERSFNNEMVHITGYPGDKGFTQMWGMSHTISEVTAERFAYLIDTAPGQSGSAIWSSKWNQPIILGIHTHGSSQVNYGVRITGEKFLEFARLISETYNIQTDGASSSLNNLTAGMEAINLGISNSSLPEIAFGKTKWEKYFGDVGVEPSLSSDIGHILESNCPYQRGKKVKDTHLLVLIPKNVKGRPFNLRALLNLIQNPKEGFPTTCVYYDDDVDYVIREPRNALCEASYWALVTKEFIPGSRGKSFAQQRKLIKSDYAVPHILEIATAILTHHVETGEKLYLDRFTRCIEKVGENFRVMIGSVESDSIEGVGFRYHSLNNDSTANDTYVMGAVRRRGL